MPIVTPSGAAGGGGGATVPCTLQSSFACQDISVPLVANVAISIQAGVFVVSGITVTLPPTKIGVGHAVVNTIRCNVSDVPNISDIIDRGAVLYVSDLTGTNTLSVSKADSPNTPIVGAGTPLDWTGTTATIVGADLSWTDTTSTVTSAAGGIYSALLLFTVEPD